MNNQALFIFLILLIGLILCSFLGVKNCSSEGFEVSTYTGVNSGQLSENNGATSVGANGNIYTNSNKGSNKSYDNYNHYSGSSNALQNGTTFYGPNGGTAQVITNSNGSQTLQVTTSIGSSPIIFIPNADSSSGSSKSVLFSSFPINSSSVQANVSYPNGTSSPMTFSINGTKVQYTLITSMPESSGQQSYISNTYSGSDGSSATLNVNSNPSQPLSNGVQQMLSITPASGSTTKPTLYASTSAYFPGSNFNSNYSSGSIFGSLFGTNTNTSTTFYGPNGGNATIVNINGQTSIKITDSNGNTTIYTPSGSSSQSGSNQQSYGPNVEYVQGSHSESVGYIQGPAGNNAIATNTNNQYSNSLPRGIPASQIPHGQEDLYILKTEIVPPVCPACPVSTACPRQEPCPPCPACARCPEPSFECKKVPNYNSISSEYLPVPVLNSFSSFGM